MSEQELVVTNGEVLTGERLFQLGMWICYYCSTLNPIEYAQCKSCHEVKFFIVYRPGDYHSPADVRAGKQAARVAFSETVGGCDPE